MNCHLQNICYFNFLSASALRHKSANRQHGSLSKTETSLQIMHCLQQRLLYCQSIATVFAGWRRSWYRPARGCAELYPPWATLEGVAWRRSKSQQLSGAQQNWQISDVDKAAQIDYTVRTPKLTHPSFAQCRRCFVTSAKRENQAEVKFVTSSKSRF